MITLCKIFSVDDEYYAAKLKSTAKKVKKPVDLDSDIDFERETDFYLVNKGENFKCEVKLMSKGNPESCDSVFAHGSRVFVANKLSDTNKKQLNSGDVQWVELRCDDGYKRFTRALEKLAIPHKDFNGNINKRLDEIFDEILPL